jgi:hypothetical protein
MTKIRKFSKNEDRVNELMNWNRYSWRLLTNTLFIVLTILSFYWCGADFAARFYFLLHFFYFRYLLHFFKLSFILYFFEFCFFKCDVEGVDGFCGHWDYWLWVPRMKCIFVVFGYLWVWRIWEWLRRSFRIDTVVDIATWLNLWPVHKVYLPLIIAWYTTFPLKVKLL